MILYTIKCFSSKNFGKLETCIAFYFFSLLKGTVFSESVSILFWYIHHNYHSNLEFRTAFFSRDSHCRHLYRTRKCSLLKGYKLCYPAVGGADVHFFWLTPTRVVGRALNAETAIVKL